MKNYAIITAAGKGTRLPGAVAKQFRPVGSKPLLAWTIDKFEQCPAIDAIHLVVSGEDLNYTHEAVVDRFKYKKVERIVAGGKTRFDSILCGLRSIPETANLVYIHDGVRPLVSIAEIEAVGKQAEAFDAAILAVRQTETLKRIEDGFVIATLDRDKILAYVQALERRDFTDDSSVCEAFGISVRIVEGSPPPSHEALISASC